MISEINDFVNSFNEIIDKVDNYSKVDEIFVELFKKAFDFEICIEHLKKDENLSAICEINDFINSFNEIVDTVYNYSNIEEIFVEFFKKAIDFEICIEHLKRSRKFKYNYFEINDFINSFNEIIDQVFDYSPIDGICVELFKKAKLFDVCIEHLKKDENLNTIIS